MTDDTAMLISRIVDACDDGEAWERFTDVGLHEPELWRDLAEAQRAHAQLSRYVNLEADTADNVDLFPPRTFLGARPWAGWAVAAVLLIGVAVLAVRPWATQTNPIETIPTLTADTARDLDALSAEEALRHYLAKGKESGDVITEIPMRQVLQIVPAESGEGYDVIYLRPIMERTTVPDLYEFGGQDESGRPTLVRYNNPARGVH